MAILDRSPSTLYSLTPEVRRYLQGIVTALGDATELASTQVVTATSSITLDTVFDNA